MSTANRTWSTTASAVGAAALAIVAAGCGGARERAPIHPFGPPVVDAGRAYLTLADGVVHFDSEGAPPGLYVSGVVEGGRFVPDGDVRGDGSLADGGTPGWVELLDGSFYAEQSGREPIRPYVPGVMTADGTFSPSSRKVVY